jgi:inorganic pyrophosphatase
LIPLVRTVELRLGEDLRKGSKRDLMVTLPSFDPDNGQLHVVVETPKGSRNKFDYDEAYGVFRLAGVLPAGAVFPYDFGFVPSTRGEDGDPLDVLLLMDEPVPMGCLVVSRLIGAVEAEQTEQEGRERNDRLVAVAASSHPHQDVTRLEQLSSYMLEEIEHFFVSYNAFKNKEFTVIARSGPERARELVQQGSRRRQDNV